MAKALPPLPPAHGGASDNMSNPASTVLPLAADPAPRALSEITPASAASTTSTTSSNADQQLVPPRPGAPAPHLPSVAPCTTPPVAASSHDSATATAAPPPLPSRRSSVILDPSALSLDTTTLPPTTAPPCLVYVPHHRRAHMVADVARVLATTPSSARAAHAARAVSWRPRYATGICVDGKWTIYLTKENTTANLDVVAEKRIAVPEAWTSRIIPVPATTAFTEVNEGGSPPQSPLATAVFFADEEERRDKGHEDGEEDDEMEKDHATAASTPPPAASPAVVPRSRTSTSSISPAATPPVAGRPRRGSLTAVLSGVASASRRASLVIAASAASAMTGTSTSSSTQAGLPALPVGRRSSTAARDASAALALVQSSDAAFLVDRPVRRSAAQRALLGSMPSPRAVRQVAGWLVGSSSSTTATSSAAPATTGRARAGSVDSVASSDEGSSAAPTVSVPAGAPGWTASASAQSFPLVLRFADARDAHRFLESLQTRGAHAPSPIVPGSPRIARTPTLPRHARTASLSDVPPRRRSSLRDHAADAVAAVTAVWASLPRSGGAVDESETILARGRSGSIATLDEPPTQPSAFSHLVTTSSVPVSPTRSEASSSVWREPYVPRVRRPSAASTATTSTTASSTLTTDRPVSDTATELKLLHAALAQIQARHLGPKAAEMALAVADREDPGGAGDPGHAGDGPATGRARARGGRSARAARGEAAGAGAARRAGAGGECRR
ncbi:hypothetical protein AMAG_03923 [Allomyces macrogynus ATCC 38327]|uniref:Uncharacterized protein n=1 Tax=Allomyces macrogynus (strain ATCC 38327) TaxID=578462 RepID=A0A0L0S737_ALLM3|nr:hypothetical protein AMAG_03923 [Allomyces macrogynus ATCC 38327]|eukprot:KNE58337.1 hypothetical protein AMAG_03923 [Allomyces macrogynus ATCC 38327]